MSLSLRVEPRGTYLCAVVTGPFDLAELQGSFLRVLDACAQHRLSQLLVDGRGVYGRMSTGERYQWAAFAAEAHQAHLAAGNPPLRLAVLARQELIDPQRFGESVARNRGMDTKATTDPAEAAAWLGIDLQDIA